jgi:hypothetical protein
MSEVYSMLVLLALMVLGITLSLYLGYKGIDPEMIGRKAFREDNPAENEESDEQPEQH